MHRRTLDSYARGAAAGEISTARQHQANFRRIEGLGAQLGKKVSGESLSCNGWAEVVKRLESGASNGVVIYRLTQLIRDAQAGRTLADLAMAGFAVYDSDAKIDLVNPRNCDDFDDAVKTEEDYRPRSSAAPTDQGGGISTGRRGRPPGNFYLCTGRDSPIRCGNCGHHLDINANARGKTYPDGELKHHYRCLKSSGGCGKTIADWRILDEIIEDIMLRWLADPRILDMIRQDQETKNAQRQPYAEEIARRESRKDHWGRLFNEGKISEDELTRMIDDLNTGIRAAQEHLSEIESAPLSRLDEEIVAHILREWHDANPAEKRDDLLRAWEGFHVLVDPGSSTDDKSAVWRRVHKPKRISVQVHPNGS